MHPRWRPGCATSPIQFQGQFRLLECAADGGILSGAYQCCKKCTPFDAQLTRFYIRVIRVRDVKWSAWQQLNYLRWISQSVSQSPDYTIIGWSFRPEKLKRKGSIVGLTLLVIPCLFMQYEKKFGFVSHEAGGQVWYEPKRLINFVLHENKQGVTNLSFNWHEWTNITNIIGLLL